ncbi:ABC transporter permease [Streptomyces sp. NPDC020917]|uniref:ABC transporter permease n=1 Tax=Streptomyces sp. NPDC020917 TaxID=3365102 RepID=UPI0037A0FE0C
MTGSTAPTPTAATATGAQPGTPASAAPGTARGHGPGERAPAAEQARFRDLVAAEWIKLWSLRSTAWVLALSGLAVIATNLNAANADSHNWPGYNADIRAHFVPVWALRDAFTNVSATILILACAGLGGIAIAGEYSTGLIRTTFTAVPARRSVVAAKVAVLTPVFTLFGTAVAFASFFGSQAILSRRHIGVAFGDPATVRVVAASALLAPVAALAGFGIGAVVRHSAATMVVSVLVLLLLHTLFSEKHRWTADIEHALPFPAWDRLTSVDGWHPPGLYGATLAGSWTVLALWPLVAVVTAVLVVGRRDL